MENDTECLNSSKKKKKKQHTYTPKTRFSYLMPTCNCKIKQRRKNYSRWKKKLKALSREAYGWPQKVKAEEKTQ